MNGKKYGWGGSVAGRLTEVKEPEVKCIGPGNNGVPEAGPESEVQQLLQRLDAELVTLREMGSLLEQRLQPVLITVPDKPAGDSAEPMADTQLARALQERVNHLGAIRLGLGQLIERVAI